ncbi:MAG TPA: thioesterase family protein [Trichocoleus sp.]
MAFEYTRTVRFHETDAAGVVYFANGLILCHEAYEASLGAAGIDLRQFFSRGSVAYPIVQAQIDFRRPLSCGDRVVISLTPRSIEATGYAIAYHLTLETDYTSSQDPASDRRSVATAYTQHVCISTADRARQALPAEMTRWIEQFS